MMNEQALRALRWAWCGFVLGCSGDSPVEHPPAPGSPPAEMKSGATAAGESAAPAAPAAGSGGGVRSAAAGTNASKPPASDPGGGDGDAGAPSVATTPAADGGMQGPREYSLSMCPGATPKVLPAERKACDGVIRCGGESRCLPGMTEQAGRAPECSAGRCVPDVAARAGRIRFQRCEGSAGSGVCIPQCFALQKNPLSAVFELGEAGCGTQEVCVPCLSPIDQTDTGACDDTCVEPAPPP